MNAYNPLESRKRPEQAGLPRQQAEAIPTEIGGGASHLVTDERLDAALNKQLARIGVLTGAIVAAATAILGLLISIK